MTCAPEPFIIYVVDDDEAVRQSVCVLLEANGCQARAFENGEDFAEFAQSSEKDPIAGCALVDVHMPGGMDGLMLLEKLRHHRISIPIIIVTGQGDVSMAVRAMKAGALDFIEKPYDEGQIIGLIEAAKKHYLDSMYVERRRSGAHQHIAKLPPREREVLQLLVAGLSNKLIAQRLDLSPRTVEAYRASVMDRLGVRSLAEAVRIALLAGLDNEG